MAGDAFLQAGDHTDAFKHYQRAAYDTDHETKEYPGAADAAWAAIVIQRDALDNRNSLPATLTTWLPPPTASRLSSQRTNVRLV